MLTSSSESSDDSLDSDELSESRSNEESDSDELSSSLEGPRVPPPEGCAKMSPASPRRVENGTPKRAENCKSGLNPSLDNVILGVPFEGPKWDPGRRTGFGLDWV